MAKFIPSEHIDTLEYDFTEYGGGSGVIPEPSTGAVRKFFRGMKSMMKEARTLLKTAADIDLDELSDEDAAKMLEHVDEAEAGAEELQAQTVLHIAVLCGGEWFTPEATEADPEPHVTVVGGSPDVVALQTLPYRVLQAFTTWLMGEIQPKRTTPGSRP